MKKFILYPTIDDKSYTGVARTVYPAALNYYVNGRLHRIDGPARICDDGSEMWLYEGVYHRIGGPAITSKNPEHQMFIETQAETYYIHGACYTEEDYWKHPLVVHCVLKEILDK